MAAQLVYHTGRSTLRFLGLCLKRQIPSGRSARGLTQSNNQHNIGAFNSQQVSVQVNPNSII